MTHGLTGVAQYVVLEKMVKVATRGGDDFKCMVLDREGTRIVSACCSMSKVADLGITHVDDLSKDRQPQPQVQLPCTSSPPALFAAFSRLPSPTAD
jgi:hypothetical protein